MSEFITALSGRGFLQSALVAGHYVCSRGAMLLVAILLGSAASTLGLALSYGPDWPAGPAIVLVTGGVYVVSDLAKGAAARCRARASVLSVQLGGKSVG